ncbi:MAG: hypothetical protein Kow0025_19530 [Thermodesulfovibrionales bacterium]
MSPSKVALIGETPLLRELCALLSENGFEVSALSLEDARGGDLGAEYDLVIANADLAWVYGEEAFLKLLLSARDFLLAGGDREPPPSFINYLMSPEDVVARVNGIIYNMKAGAEGLPVRSSPRVPVDIAVEYEHDGVPHQSALQTLSAKGAFISALNPLPRGAVLKLSFALPGGGASIESRARVLYTIEYDLARGIISHPTSSEKAIAALPGMAVLFEEIPEPASKAIEAFIRQSLSA